MPDLKIRATSAEGIFSSGGGGGGELTAEGTTSISEGVPFTISALSGQNFGTGPTTVLFDTLSGGEAGTDLETDNPIVGAYTQTGTARWRADADVPPRSGDSSIVMYLPDGNGDQALRTTWGAATVVSARYWTFIPVGGAIPGAAVGSYSPSGSNWKIFWLGTTSGMTGGTDVCLPTFGGFNSSSISGNGNTGLDGDGCCWNNYDTIQANYRYGQWTMIEVLQDSITPRIRIMHCGSITGVNRYLSPTPNGVPESRGYWGNSTNQWWSHGNLMGYLRDPSGTEPNSSSDLGGIWPNSRIYHADMTIKTGPGAWADVFFGDAASIDDCTDLRHCQITSWTTSTITATPRGTDLVDLDGWYLHIRLADDTYLPGRLIS